MLHHSSRCGRGHTRPMAGLTSGSVPAGESEPVIEGVVESSTHEIAQQAPGNGPNIEQSFDRLAQIMTIVVQNQTQAHVGNANTIERVRSLRARTFNGSGEPPEAESWFVKLERIFDVMKCSENDRLSFATFLLEVDLTIGGRWWRDDIRGMLRLLGPFSIRNSTIINFLLCIRILNGVNSFSWFKDL